MAEAVLRYELTGKTETSVASAGLGALVGHAADPHAIDLMAERGLDISGHRARQLTPDMVAGSDLVLVMESGQKRSIDSVEPAARGKVYRLCEWSDRDVPDPYRQPREAFEASLALIDEGVGMWAGKIADGMD